jgi:hypothetical protein
MNGWNHRGFFTIAMKRFVLSGSKHMDSCFTAVFIQMQHTSFSGQCGGRTVASGGNVTQKNMLAHTSGKTTTRPPVFI